jgi:hypothetical protein
LASKANAHFVSPTLNSPYRPRGLDQLNRATSAHLASLALVLALLASQPAGATAASQSEFSSASGSIASAFLAVSSAQQSGGNVTALVAQLNLALKLYMQADSENQSQPSQASADLRNATIIAEKVGTNAPAVGQAGASARQLQTYLSAGAAVAVVAMAALVYVFGDRVYRRLWLRVYSGHLVKRVG